MLVLFETPAGHALFKLQDDAAVTSANRKDLESQPVIKSLVKLKAFSRFSDTTAALVAATGLVDGKPSKDLRKFLKKQVAPDESVAVADSKLGAAIREKTGLQCIFSAGVTDLMRGIRANIDSLLENERDASSAALRSDMVLGLSHSLCHYKLKFSPDKVDTMIVQAISLLDELDKEINIYAMRLREWYGWHFPEMGKIVADNSAYARTVDKMGVRSVANECDFSDILEDETESELKAAARISMGTDISDEDVLNIRALCAQVVSLTDYRTTLFDYLRNRMVAIAPNLTAMVGELVGARLVAHAGSLLTLAKYPASTVQILGAEKALFRALKTKHATPKYGLIFHASVVGQAAPKHKGKISRTLSAKTALAIRVDALGDAGEDASVGEQGRLAVESRLSQLEGRTEFAVSRLKLGDKTPRYEKNDGAGKGFNASGDMMVATPKSDRGVEASPGSRILNATSKSPDEDVDMAQAELTPGKTGSEKKKKKKKTKREGMNGSAEGKAEEEGDVETSKVKKKSKEATGDEDGEVETPKAKKKKEKEAKSSEKKKKKRKRSEMEAEGDATPEKKKKKKKKS